MEMLHLLCKFLFLWLRYKKKSTELYIAGINRVTLLYYILSVLGLSRLCLKNICGEVYYSICKVFCRLCNFYSVQGSCSA